MSKVKQVQRRATPFLGGDTFMEWHKEKAKSSMSQAFKDAEYACAIITFKTDAKLTWDFIKGTAMGMFIVGIPLFIVISLALEIAK